MASTTALFTGMSGLNANARNLDVIGNNIANVNTTAFKGSRLMFSTMFSRTLGQGTPPGDVTGGTNPFQIGLGVATAGTQRNMNAGTISATGDSRDMAIDAGGMFIVRRGESQLYTRAGAFRPNAENVLTNITGDVLMGYGVDEEFNVVRSQLEPMRAPVGQLRIAEATRNVRVAGNLRANGALPTLGSINTLGASPTAGFRLVPGATPAPGAGEVLTAANRLVDIEDPQTAAGSGTRLFQAGQIIEVRAVEKGDTTAGTSSNASSRLLPPARLSITATTSVQDLMNFYRDALGIVPSTGANPDGNTPGVTLDAATGRIRIVGNTGAANDLTIEADDIRLLASDGTTLVRTPFVPNKLATADGESVRTTFVTYDSLGAQVTVDVTMVLAGRTDTTTSWRYFVESGDGAGVALAAGTGELTFGTDGQLINSTPVTVSIDRSGTGAATPMNFSLAFGGGESTLTSLESRRSEVAAVFRDGAPTGVLTGYAIGQDGSVTGSFSNGLTRPLGELALAVFSNPEGLLETGGNLFEVAPNAGPPVITAPGTFGAGRIVSGALELSNVDIGEEFIKMILTSTGYSASSRVIRTADELMQQLLVLGR